MKLPSMDPVQSSNIAAMGYDKGLFVTFRNGSTYHYPGVSRGVYDQARATESVGRWFAQQIRGNYDGSKINADADAE